MKTLKLNRNYILVLLLSAAIISLFLLEAALGMIQIDVHIDIADQVVAEPAPTPIQVIAGPTPPPAAAALEVKEPTPLAIRATGPDQVVALATPPAAVSTPVGSLVTRRSIPNAFIMIASAAVVVILAAGAWHETGYGANSDRYSRAGPASFGNSILRARYLLLVVFVIAFIALPGCGFLRIEPLTIPFGGKDNNYGVERPLPDNKLESDPFDLPPIDLPWNIT